MSSAGIDYGMGRTNINHETGIRYGVISQHAVSQAWADSSEPDYGEPSCPKCGNFAPLFDSDKHDTFPGLGRRYHSADYACEACELTLDGDEVFGDEPQGWNYASDGYQLTDCLDSDIMVLQSPFYTMGAYCSPCVPGAVSLDSPIADGAKAYCLGHDWFESGAAPYPVYSVATGELIPAPAAG